MGRPRSGHPIIGRWVVRQSVWSSTTASGAFLRTVDAGLSAALGLVTLATGGDDLTIAGLETEPELASGVLVELELACHGSPSGLVGREENYSCAPARVEDVPYIPNWIDLDGLANLRDLGGIVTRDGRTIKRGVLLRTDNLVALPPESQRKLIDDYGLADVIDLRTNRERHRHGIGPLDERGLVRTAKLSLYPEDDPTLEVPPWHDDDYTPKAIVHEEHSRFLAEHYLEYLANRPDSVVNALRLIAHAPATVAVNCAAGKDRTGTVIACVLAALGVADESIVADYAASSERVDRILARLGEEASGGSNDHDMRPEAQMTRPATMEGFLAGVRERFGSVPDWLAENGWTPEDQAALEAKLLE